MGERTPLDVFLDAWIDDQEDKRKMARLGPRRLHPDWYGKPEPDVPTPRQLRDSANGPWGPEND